MASFPFPFHCFHHKWSLLLLYKRNSEVTKLIPAIRIRLKEQGEMKELLLICSAIVKDHQVLESTTELVAVSVVNLIQSHAT